MSFQILEPVQNPPESEDRGRLPKYALIVDAALANLGKWIPIQFDTMQETKACYSGIRKAKQSGGDRNYLRNLEVRIRMSEKTLYVMRKTA